MTEREKSLSTKTNTLPAGSPHQRKVQIVTMGEQIKPETEPSPASYTEISIMALWLLKASFSPIFPITFRYAS